MSYEKRCGYVFYSAVLALYPIAIFRFHLVMTLWTWGCTHLVQVLVIDTQYHSSSSFRLYTMVVSAFDEYTEAAIQVRLPSEFFVRQ